MLELKKISMIAATLMTMGTAAAAQGMGPENVNPWQQCGIGIAVFPDNGTAAAISNVIWDLGTTAVSSALSSPENCQGTSMSAAMFIQRAHDPLITDTAVGEGEYLNTLLTGIACDESVKPAVVADLRDYMAAQVQDASYVEMDHSAKAEAYFMALRDVVRTDYATTCENF